MFYLILCLLLIFTAWTGVAKAAVDRLEILERQLHLSDLGIELLGGAAVLHALQACDLKAQLLELEFLKEKKCFGGFELRAAFEHDAL